MLDRLEAMATNGKRLPFSRRSLIDHVVVLEIMDQVRVAIPREIQEAREILQSREHVVNQAMLEAQRIRIAAESESKDRLDDSELVKQAQTRADEIVKGAQEKGQRILERANAAIGARSAGANEYSQDVLRKLEEEVTTILATIRRGIEVLDSHGGAADKLAKD